jgi:transporter family protein
MLDGIILGLLAMLGWGIADYLLKKPSIALGPRQTLFFMQLISLIINIPLLFFIKPSLNFVDLGLFMIGGAVDYFAYINFLEALRLGEISVVTPISAVYSVLTVILSVIFLHEDLTILRIVSIAIAILGIVLASTDLKRIHKMHTLKGVPNAFFSLIGWGIYLFLVGFLEQRNGWLITYLFTSIMLFVFSFFGFLFAKNKTSIKGNIAILTAISLLYTAAWFFENIGFSVTYVSIIAVISSLSPLITILLASIFLKEKLVANQKIGVALIMGSIILISIS